MPFWSCKTTRNDAHLSNNFLRRGVVTNRQGSSNDKNHTVYPTTLSEDGQAVCDPRVANSECDIYRKQAISKYTAPISDTKSNPCGIKFSNLTAASLLPRARWRSHDTQQPTHFDIHFWQISLVNCAVPCAEPSKRGDHICEIRQARHHCVFNNENIRPPSGVPK